MPDGNQSRNSKTFTVGVRFTQQQKQLLGQVQASIAMSKGEAVTYGEAIEIACEAFRRGVAAEPTHGGTWVSPDRKIYLDRLAKALSAPGVDTRLFSALEVALTALESSTRQ